MSLGVQPTNRVLQLKIASGATASQILPIGTSQDSLCIIAPGTLDAGTYVLKASGDGTTMANVHDGSADITCPAAGKGRIYLGWKFPYIQITGPSAAADRTFLVCIS